MSREYLPYYTPGQKGYVQKQVRTRLKALRNLPIFNRDTGSKEIAERKKSLRIYNDIVKSKGYTYPSDNRRTLSLSRKSFTNQTKNLKGSQYFIDQFRGTMQDNYNLNRSRKKYYVNRDILENQAKIIRDKEEQEKLEPLQQYFNNTPTKRIIEQNGK